jgi:hypothetical protein
LEEADDLAVLASYSLSKRFESGSTKNLFRKFLA